MENFNFYDKIIPITSIQNSEFKYAYYFDNGLLFMILRKSSKNN